MAKKKASKRRSHSSRKLRKEKPVKITVELSRRQARALRKLAKICSDGDLSAALEKVARSFEE